MKTHTALAAAFAMLLSASAVAQSAFDQIDLGRQPQAEPAPRQNINAGDLAREMLDWDQAEKRRKEREQAEREALARAEEERKAREQAEQEEREEAERLERKAEKERERELKRQQDEHNLKRTETIMQGIGDILEAYRHYQ